ncbi:MAG TPA: transglutaminase-like domain-containing protein [Geobacteraceae bacterium]
MKYLRLCLIAAVICFSLAASLGAASPASVPLGTPPLGERWFGISFDGERTGFASQNISVDSGGGYTIRSEGSVKMLVLGFSREASSWEEYRVNRDLSLRSFAVREVIDGSPLRLSGEVTPRGVRVTVETADKKEEKLLKVKGAVYPPPVVNIYPLMRGAVAGKVYRLRMLDVEAVKVKEVKVTVLGKEPQADGTPLLHLQNDLYTFVDNDIWVDLQGNTVRESVRNDLIVTTVEDAATIARFVLDAAVAKKDLILDFSRVRVEPPLDAPEKLRRLVVEFAGIPGSVPLLQGAGQKAARTEGERVLFTLERPQPSAAGAGEDASDAGRYLEATQRIPSGTPEIIARKDEVLNGVRGEPLAAVGKLARWVAEYVTDTVTDSHSALETLASRKGNCQAHARLYVALARAAGIPSRFVSGLVYVPDKGFLYHSWAESFVGGAWLSVDPTFAQVPADVTHVKLVEGDAPEEMLPLAGIVGRISARVVEQQ